MSKQREYLTDQKVDHARKQILFIKPFLILTIILIIIGVIAIWLDFSITIKIIVGISILLSGFTCVYMTIRIYRFTDKAEIKSKTSKGD